MQQRGGNAWLVGAALIRDSGSWAAVAGGSELAAAGWQAALSCAGGARACGYTMIEASAQLRPAGLGGALEWVVRARARAPFGAHGRGPAGLRGWHHSCKLDS